MAEKEKQPVACVVCGVFFVPRHGNCRMCSPACRDERQRSNVRSWQRAHAPSALRKQEKQSVSDVERYIQEHHKRTGVWLSYGKAVVRMAAEGWRT